VSDHDTPTLLVAKGDQGTRAFLLDNLAADDYEPRGAQTADETRLKLRNHAPAALLLGTSGRSAIRSRWCGRSARAMPAATPILL
jgi:hypothetical protein